MKRTPFEKLLRKVVKHRSNGDFLRFEVYDNDTKELLYRNSFNLSDNGEIAGYPYRITYKRCVKFHKDGYENQGIWNELLDKDELPKFKERKSYHALLIARGMDTDEDTIIIERVKHKK